MKEIAYRGGVIRFRIPDHWREEYEPQGGGAFYDDTVRDSSTLRLNVLTLERDPGNTDSLERMLIELPASGTHEATVTQLSNGNVLRRYISDAEEDGIALKIVNWELANEVAGTVRLAMFRHTVLASRFGSKDVQAEIAMLGREISEAVFTQLSAEEIRALCSTSTSTSWLQRLKEWF